VFVVVALDDGELESGVDDDDVTGSVISTHVTDRQTDIQTHRYRHSERQTDRQCTTQIDTIWLMYVL